MRLSICITSCNRLKYTKALIESLRDFYNNPEVEILVCDMWSTEPGLRKYFSDLEVAGILKVVGMSYDLERNWINDEYIGRNRLIESAAGDYLMFLQDDGQFIATSDVVWKYIEDFEKMNDVYCLDIYGVRKQTMRDTVEMTPIKTNGTKYWTRKDRHFLTTGIYKKEVYETLGPYPTDWPQEKSYWGRSEDWAAKKFKQEYPNGQICRVHVPLMLSIWNDPRGGYAFIRESKRFGHYIGPVDNSLYYEKNVTLDRVEKLNKESIGPIGFMEIANPLGWTLATTSDGEQKKYNQWQIMEFDGPSEDLP